MPFTKNDFDAAMRDVFYLRNEVNNLITQLRNQTGDGFNWIMDEVDGMLGSFQKLGEVQTLSYTESKNTMDTGGTERQFNPLCSIPAGGTVYFNVNCTFNLYLPTVDGIATQCEAYIGTTNPTDTKTGAVNGKAVAETPKYVSGDTPYYIYVTVPLSGYYYNSSSTDMTRLPIYGKLTKAKGESITGNVVGKVEISGYAAVLL